MEQKQEQEQVQVQVRWENLYFVDFGIWISAFPKLRTSRTSFFLPNKIVRSVSEAGIDKSRCQRKVRRKKFRIRISNQESKNKLMCNHNFVKGKDVFFLLTFWISLPQSFYSSNSIGGVKKGSNCPITHFTTSNVEQ